MILHHPRTRPESWRTHRQQLKAHWAIPFLVVEWSWQWVAYVLSNWSFLEVLEYLGSFSVLIAVIFYYTEAGDRLKQKHYQAWQVINTAQGRGGSGGRLEALQELNADGVALVGVDVSSAFLQGVRLEGARLTRSNFNAADLRGSSLRNAELEFANLHYANLRGSDVRGARLQNADFTDADLNGANLGGADLAGAMLDSADLRNADLTGVKWREIRSIARANIAGVKNPPPGFVAWALKQRAEITSEPVETARQ